MKENKYDDNNFFDQYSRMSRSVDGLSGAGEWHVLEKMLPCFDGKRVLDLGCGFGWHCQYAAQHGAKYVLGIDLSEKMLDEARKMNRFDSVEYKRMAIEDFDYEPNTFDVVLSSLAFHYVKSFDDVCRKIHRCLSEGGVFIFSAEHPVFTAYGDQDWIYDDEGNRKHWPVDRYFEQGERTAVFLGEEIVKYHRTLDSYINSLFSNGFEITGFSEPEPAEVAIEKISGMKDELRRPIFFIISATRNTK